MNRPRPNWIRTLKQLFSPIRKKRSRTRLGVEALEGRELPASLLADINPGASGSDPTQFATVNGTLFFNANDGVNGNALWKSNGTTTTLVKSVGAFPVDLTNVNGTLYFFATTSSTSADLWKSDGTTAGTVLVKTISSGSSTYYGPISDIANVNGTLLFSASGGTNGYELWKSDGTTAGTVLVKDINPGSNSSRPRNLTAVNGVAYFTADNGTNGRELWKSDGTAAGTVLVKDIRSGASGSDALDLTNMNGTLFFSANDGVTSPELWKSDGTAAGTVLVKDIAPGALQSVPSSLTNVNGTLFFRALDTTNGTELWKSDGTTAGTTLVKDIISGYSGSFPLGLTNVNGTLFFKATDTTGAGGLWKSNGTAAGTTLVKQINTGFTTGYTDIGTSVNVNGTLFFVGHEATQGFQLWQSDGTAAGTSVVRNLIVDSLSAGLANVNGTLLFAADDAAHGQELWTNSPVDTTGAFVQSVVFSTKLAPGTATFDTATVTFNESIDPTSFTIPQVLGIFGPTENSISVTGISAVAGSANKVFEISFANQSALGHYSLLLGQAIRDVANNQMDDNKNGINGEVAVGPGGDQHQANAILRDPTLTSGAAVTSAVFSGTAANTFDKVRLTFNQAIDFSSANVSDVTVTGPGGSPLFVTQIAVVTGTTNAIDVSFTPANTLGQYTITTGVDILNFGGAAGNKLNQNGNAVNGEAGIAPTGDQFTGTGTLGTDTLGASITAAAFSGTAANTFDKVRLTFNEAINASTFTTSDVTLSGPSGAITPTSVTLVSGTTNQFDVTFASQSAVGTYAITTGTDILDLANNKMDQNQNLINGQPGVAPAGDQFQSTATLGTDTSGASVTSAVFSGTAAGNFDKVRLTFNEAINASTFTTSDVTLSGPSSAITPTSVTAVAGSTTQFDVTFPSQSTKGNYTITTGVNIADLAGNLMNQNQNTVNGEVPPTSPSDQFTGTGTLTGTDTLGASITAAAFSGTAANTFDKVRFTFSEAMDASTFTTADVLAVTGPSGLITVSAVTPVAGSTTQFDVTFPAQSTKGNYSIATGVNIADLAGNLMDQNKNGTNGEDPADRFSGSGTLNPTTGSGTSITGAVFSGASATVFDRVRLTFSGAIDASTFTSADVLSLTDPNGTSIPVIGVTAVAGTTNQFDVTFAARLTKGQYAITTGVNIADLAGNLMDQNKNGTSGETPQDQFNGSGTLKATTTMLAVGASDGSIRILDANTRAEIVSEFRPLDVGGVPYAGLVQVALGDITGDGVADLFVTAANPVGSFQVDASKSGRVFVYDGATLAAGTIPTDPVHVFTPFATTDGPSGNVGAYTNGLNIGTGDVNGDGKVDLIAATRGGSATAGNREYGRFVVLDIGAASDGSSDTTIGSIIKPFGNSYEKGVVVAAGDADQNGRAEVAVTRGGPVAQSNPNKSIKLKAYQFAGGALAELNLSGRVDSNGNPVPFAPFGNIVGTTGSVIERDARITFLDSDGDGKQELVFSALDRVSDPTNVQVRIGLYALNTNTGAATLVSSGPTGTPGFTYTVSNQVIDYAITHVNLSGAGSTDLAMILQTAAPGIQYLDPVTGEVKTGSFSLSVLNGGVSIDGI